MKTIWRRHGRDILLVALFFALFGLFGVWPVLRSAWLSFTDYHATDDPAWVGLRNYAELAADERFWTALGNTAAYMPCNVPCRPCATKATARSGATASTPLPGPIPASTSTPRWPTS